LQATRYNGRIAELEQEPRIMPPFDRDAYYPGQLSRRTFIVSCAACAAAGDVLAQAPTPIALRKLNCFEIRVSDVDASVRFYQDLFGMPVQARDGSRVALRIGEGPQFMRVRPVTAGEAPGIVHIGYSVADFDVTRMQSALSQHGFEPIDAPAESEPGIAHAMKSWIRTHAQTRDLYFADARGLIVQLTDPAYCGGGGPAGTVCSAPEPTPKGRMRLHDLNHFTVFVNDGAEANRFYQTMFGLSVQTYQGPQAPVTGIGDGFQFVMYAGARREETTPANIHHGCFNMPGFDVDRVLATLTDYGLTARGDAPVGPLMHYVSLRMPERGGAEGGTPELYFTDPDGILMQLQDVSYCGGGGYLGNECLKP
jgi:catechol 2,3-dioxygenase-like lactoylglutathione lyase family enzyme